MSHRTTTRLSALALTGLFATAPCAFAASAAQEKAAPKDSRPAAAGQTPAGQTPAGPAAAADQGDGRRSAYEKYIEGERFERQGDYVRAVESYKQAIQLDPTAVEPRVTLARLYLSNRNMEEAKAVAKDALKSNPDEVSVHAVLSEIYVMEAVSGGSIDKDKARAAIAEIETATKLDEKVNIQLGNQSIKALAVLAQLYQTVGENDKALATFERLTKVDNASSETFTSMARLYFEQRKYREAARAADQARKLDSTNFDAMQVLAMSLIRSGRAAEAVDVYKQLREALPADASDEAKNRVTVDFADALMQAGRYQEAIDTVKPLLAKDAKNVGAVRVTTDAERRSGRRDEAVKTLEAALVGQDVSESLELVFALAETYEEMGNYDKAISTYEDALAVLVNPDGTVSASDRQNAGVILRRIALAHKNAGHKEKVTATYERMRKALGTDDSTPDMLEVQDAIEATNYDAAIAQARKAGSTAKGDQKRTFQFLEAQALGKKGDLPDAVKVLQGMMTGSTADDSDVYAFMSAIQLDAADTTNAEKSIRKALESDPNDTGLLITLSSIQDKAAQYKESEATLRKVLDLDPGNATALNNLGYFLTERKERLDEALQLIQRAVNIDPTNGSFLDSLGWLYFQMGKLPEAKRYLEQAIVYERQSSTIREHLGDLYLKLGDAAKAHQYWEAALKLSNEREEIARLRGKLKE